MSRYLLALLLGLVTASSAAAQGAFGSGPIREEEPDIRIEGRGQHALNGHGTRFETIHNPGTGKFERRSVTVAPMANRVIEREQVYDPKTGTAMSRAVQRDPWTGQAVEARRMTNGLTGESVQIIGTVNPISGQSFGFVRRTYVDPVTGAVRRDAGQHNSYFAGPGLGSFGSGTSLYHPNSGWIRHGVPPR